MKILAIETSCDETAMALVEAEGRLSAGRQGLRAPRFRILKSVVSSQIKVHAPYGGVVPNLAKREHLKNLPKVFKTLYPSAKGGSPPKEDGPRAHASGGKPYTSSSLKTRQSLNDLNPDLIAVTVGPGLEPALWTGIEFAKNLAKKLRKPLVGVNHLEGHLYSPLMQNVKISAKGGSASGGKNQNIGIAFPAISLIVSGGHTILVKMDSLANYKKIGETRDDAAGEAFDKVARMLGLPYPGGPEVEQLARKGNPNAIPFPRPMLHTKTYDFSFSGLKTAVLYYLRDKEFSQWPIANSATGKRKTLNPIGYTLLANVAASFQQAVIDVLVKKTMRAAEEFGARSVMLSGGVAANKALQKNLRLMTHNLRLNFFVPPPSLNTDNATMIAGAAYINYLRKKRYRLTAQPNLNL